jgi:GH15 family glucan-1,4-alpha-glucosidase
MDFGIIGNCQYSALISRMGDVVWLCWPRFDSSFVFGSLLDEERGGRYSIRPAGDQFTTTQSYLPNTNVLRTRFEAHDGAFDILDFAPRFHQHDRYFRPTMLIRILVPLRGAPLVKVVCRPTWNYGAHGLKCSVGSNHLEFDGGPAPIRLTSDVSLTHIVEGRPFSLSRRQYLALTWGQPLEAPLTQTCEDFLARTTAYWQRWVKHCHLPAIRQREVIRSALVLKLHQFEDTGAIIAAATTSLPEAPQSSRTWDYRYCWLRDAYFTVSALRRLSHFEELEGFERFLRDVTRTSSGRLQPVYTISGEADLREQELTPLDGYLGHKPVRIGNGAYLQTQHDVYGQALMALQPLFTDIRFTSGATPQSLDIIPMLLTAVEGAFGRPDAGIWEFRGCERIHTFSMLMHWAGARAAGHIAAESAVRQLRDRAKDIESRARAWIEQHAWNDALGALQISPDVPDLDAALLLAINLGFFKPSDPRAARMVDSIQRSLGSERGLLRRYRLDDGLGPAASCFTVCSFWLAEAMARVGRLEDGCKLFDTVMEHANHLGLLSEDIDVETGRLWGNFPQTYSHVGLINAAFALEREMERRQPLLLDGDEAYGDEACVASDIRGGKTAQGRR